MDQIDRLHRRCWNILSYNDMCIIDNEIKSIDDKQQKQNEWERKDKHQHDDVVPVFSVPWSLRIREGHLDL